MSEPIEVPKASWRRDGLLRGGIAPGGLAVAGAGVAWHGLDLTGWLVTGGLGLAGAGLEAWRTWLSYQYAVTELRSSDRAERRSTALERRRLELEHERAVLAQSTNDAHRTTRLEKVTPDEVIELARIEEAQELWATPVPQRSASLTIDLRENPMDLHESPSPDPLGPLERASGHSDTGPPGGWANTGSMGDVHGRLSADPSGEMGGWVGSTSMGDARGRQGGPVPSDSGDFYREVPAPRRPRGRDRYRGP